MSHCENTWIAIATQHRGIIYNTFNTVAKSYGQCMINKYTPAYTDTLPLGLRGTYVVEYVKTKLYTERLFFTFVII